MSGANGLWVYGVALTVLECAGAPDASATIIVGKTSVETKSGFEILGEGKETSPRGSTEVRVTGELEPASDTAPRSP